MNKIARRSAIAAAVVAMSIGVGHNAHALGISLIDPPAPFMPAGQTYSHLAAEWWQWALTQPASTNPLADATGAECGNGQSGSVFFLGGNITGGTINRTCRVPYGKTIVFPILNALAAAFPSDPTSQQTEPFLRAEAAQEIQGATNLHAEVDGLPVLFVNAYQEKSDTFTATLPADNIFGVPGPQPISLGLDQGYYVGVSPLTPGSHKIHWHGELPGGFVLDVTYTLNVTLF